mmetsp:Transcript_12186/g.17773  ORF Transcript_12186/g.17773 Transcript_12186/m.17773 type:complete len:87 (-) Transcript_12186:202-462(-)
MCKYPSTLSPHFKFKTEKDWEESDNKHDAKHKNVGVWLRTITCKCKDKKLFFNKLIIAGRMSQKKIVSFSLLIQLYTQVKMEREKS